MKGISASVFKGDLAGGFASAIVALPGNIVYGTIAFAPLGPQFAGKGILAGMFSSVFAGLMASLFGGTKAMVTGPQAPTALVFGSAMGQLIASGLIHPETQADIILTMLFGAALLGGAIQILFGLFKVGHSVKFIPYPVIAGIMTGTGLLIIKSQIPDMLGTPQLPIGELLGDPSRIQPLTVLVAMLTAILMWKGPAWVPKIPGSILAILGGTGIYYSIVWLGFSDNIGPTLNAIPSVCPGPEYLSKFIPVFSDANYRPLFPILITTSFTLAILSSIDSMLSSVSLQSYTEQRSETNKELRAQGIGTLVASFFGGLPGTGYTNRSIVNFESGGRTKFSGVTHSLIILLFVLVFSSLIEMIPRAVMSGIIFIIGLLIMDKVTLKLIGNALIGKFQKNFQVNLNFGLVCLVALITVFFGLIVAVSAGIFLSVIIFIVQMSKSTVRGILDGSKIRSNRQRYPKLMDILNGQGHRIAIIELEGSIFFGSADNLTVEIEKLASRDVLFFVLDMKRVTLLDSTAAKIIEQTNNWLNKQNKVLAISYIEEDGRLWRFITDVGLDKSIPPQYFFEDTHQALEFFEDELLKRIASEDILDETKLTLNELLGLSHVDIEKTMMIADYIDRECYRSGDIIFKQGDPANALYFISLGTAAITVKIPQSTRVKRLQTLSFGTFFGEMVLFGEKFRSANVEALEDLACFRITLDKYEKMRKESPELALAIMNTINRTLTARLQDAYRMISELER